MQAPTLSELRTKAASLGIEPKGKDRYELMTAIQPHEQREQELRLECVNRGLPTEGTAKDLELRLAGVSSDGITVQDRKTYYIVAGLSLVLGLLGLVLSIPHVASALHTIMGTPYWVAFLLALVIDLGIVGCKVIDTLHHKFRLPDVVRYGVWILLAACLGFSGILNSYEFLQTAETFGARVLAVMSAFFLVGFVFAMFMVGSAMLVKCEDRAMEKTEAEEKALTRAEKILSILREVEDIARVVDKIKG